MTATPFPLDLQTDLYVGGSWQAAKSYVYQRAGDSPPVTVDRGRGDEMSQMNASSSAFEVNNRSGRFSPKNPLSPWFGQFSRNTPVRHSVPAQANFLRLESPAARAYVADTAALHVTGSIEMRIAADLTDWQGGVLACKWDGGACWAWSLDPDGTLAFRWVDGSLAQHVAFSTVPAPFWRGTRALRVTLDASTGNVTFYTAASIDGTYSQLGAVVNPTGAATTVSSSTGSALQVGYSFSFTPAGICGRVAEYRLYNGIGGTVVADAVMSGVTAGAATWTDSAGLTWLLAGGAEASSRDYRYHGECSELPPVWDSTGTDQSVQVKAGGIWRRLGQGQTPAQSPMRRALTTRAGTLAPVAYWPWEDSAGAQALGSASGGPAMQFDGQPKLATDSSFIASMPLPQLNGGRFRGQVFPYSGAGSIVVRFLMKLGTAPGATTTLVRLVTSGSVPVVDLQVTAGGFIQLASSGGAFTVGPLSSPAAGGGSWSGQPWWMSIELQPSGSSMTVSLVMLAPGATTAYGGIYATLTTSAPGNLSNLYVNPYGQFSDTVMGHFSVQADWETMFALQQPLDAWAGELAGNRFPRLCAEDGIAARVIGSPAYSAAMGPQGIDTIQNLLQSVEEADQGQLYEPRQVLGIGYRTCASMCNQSPRVTVDYSQAQLGGTGGGGTGLKPTLDDSRLRNNWTVTRSSPGGGGAQGMAYQATLDDGSATSVPVAGDYSDSLTANVESDTQVPDLAGWKTHVGSVDEYRWPAIPFNLRRAAIQNAGPYYPLLSVDVGDYAQLTNMPNVVLADPVKQLAWGLKESLGGMHHTLEWNGVPESTHEVIVLDDPVYGRVDTDGSSLAVAATSTATSLTVATASGFPPWTEDPGDMPFDIGIAGERITVTAVGASARPNTRVGAYLDQSNFEQADYNGVASLWHSWTGDGNPVARYYAGFNLSGYTTNLQEIVASGARICLSLQPAYSPPNATDLASMTSLLATLKAAGADVLVTVWHEPYFGGLSAAQYRAAVQFYAPSLRAYYPFWCVFSGNDTVESNGYYPGDSFVDGLACDVYLTGGFSFTANFLTNTQAMADAHGKPLAIWEMGTSTGPNFLTLDNTYFATTIGNWAAGSNCGAPFRSAVTNPFGTQLGALGFAATAAGNYSVTSAAAVHYATQMQACSAGDEITVGSWVQAATTGRACTAAATFFTSAGVFVSTIASADASATATDAAGTWTSVMGRVTAPATAAFYAETVQVASAGAGEVHRLGLPWCADSTATGHTQGGATAWWQWAQATMSARLATGKSNGDIIAFNAGMPGSSQATAIQFAADYRIGLWQAIVTALDGTGGPQQMTVTRSVNGVVKAQSAGADVRLWYPPVLALT